VPGSSIPGVMIAWKPWSSQSWRKKLTYSISYDDGLASVTQERREEGLTRIETFLTEHEALNRACRLLDDGTQHAISVCDSFGNVLSGVRLQLKLGFSGE